MPLINIEQVCLNRRIGEGCKEILRDITFGIQKGEICTIIGPSGSGKSTLLRLLNRLLDPSSGSIFLADTNISALPVLELRKRIGMVFQQPALFPGTVESNVCYGPRLAKQSCLQPERYLAMVGLEESMLKRDAAQLSGGQQQRVAIARCLANNPEVLLLDEPTSALDLRATEQVEILVRGLATSLGLTIVWVTHDLGQARRMGDRTAVLIDGQVVEARPTAEVFSAPENPLTTQFIAGVLLPGGEDI